MKKILTVIAFAAFASIVAAQHATPREQFERARLLDESNRKLNEALSLYTRVAEQATEPDLAAAALLRAGLLHDRLGHRAESLRLLKAVVAKHRDQQAVVREAEARLARLTTGPAAADIVLRRIEGMDDVMGAPSPDGRLLSLTDWQTGDLAVRDLSAGATRRLTKKGSWTDSDALALFSIFSPDGAQLAYSWFNGKTFELRTIRVDGTDDRVLLRGEGLAFYWPHDWSRDGRYILAQLDDRTSRIALVSVADGSTRTVKTLASGSPRRMALSPDGSYIAYDFPQDERSPKCDVFLLSVDGRRDTRVIEHAADDVLLGWTPDGGRILFGSDRSRSMSAWLLAVADGKGQGAPQLVKTDIGTVWGMGFTRAGAYYYALATGALEVYLAPFEAAAARIGAAEKITERFIEAAPSPVFSPDGAQLAYLTLRIRSPMSTVPPVVNIMTLASRQVRELLPALRQAQRIIWSPDSKSLLTVGTDPKGDKGIYRIDAYSGEVSRLVEFGGAIVAPALARDGRTLFYLRTEPGSTVTRIVARDLATGAERDVHRAAPPKSVRRMALSPDFTRIAYVEHDLASKSSALNVIAVEGGTPRTVTTATAPEQIVTGWAMLAWSADSRWIVFAKGVPNQRDLWRVAAEGGTPARIEGPLKGLFDVAVHPDGSRVALGAGQLRKEVWVMENFLPAGTPTASRR